jgi:hypothetical protein
MKSHLANVGLGLSLITLVAGCACEMRTATAHRSLDIGSAPGARGFVEFYSPTNKSVVPIYRINNDGTAQLMSAVGLEAGDRYNFDRSPYVVAERLTVAAPAGKQQFRIDGQGPFVNVNVIEGKTTPVAIDYKLLEQADAFVVYRADARVLDSVPAKKE